MFGKSLQTKVSATDFKTSKVMLGCVKHAHSIRRRLIGVRASLATQSPLVSSGIDPCIQPRALFLPSVFVAVPNAPRAALQLAHRLALAVIAATNSQKHWVIIVFGLLFHFLIGDL